MRSNSGSANVDLEGKSRTRFREPVLLVGTRNFGFERENSNGVLKRSGRFFSSLTLQEMRTVDRHGGSKGHTIRCLRIRPDVCHTRVTLYFPLTRNAGGSALCIPFCSHIVHHHLTQLEKLHSSADSPMLLVRRPTIFRIRKAIL